MFATLKSHAVALVIRAMLAGTIGAAEADQKQDTDGIRVTWQKDAEIRLALDEDGEISFDSPIEIRLHGKVRVEGEHFQLQADRLAFDAAAGSLMLESSQADGARLSLRTPGKEQALHVVGRRLLFRLRDQRLIVHGPGALRVGNQ